MHPDGGPDGPPGVRGFRYLKAQGIVWFVWNGPKYERDLKRNAFLQSHVAGIQQRVRDLTF